MRGLAGGVDAGGVEGGDGAAEAHAAGEALRDLLPLAAASAEQGGAQDELEIAAQGDLEVRLYGAVGAEGAVCLVVVVGREGAGWRVF